MVAQKFYDQVAHELSQHGPIAGLWAKAYAESDGDDAKAKARYLLLRATQLEEEDSDRQASKREEPKTSDSSHHWIIAAGSLFALVVVFAVYQREVSNLSQTTLSIAADDWTGPTPQRPTYGKRAEWPTTLELEDGLTASVSLRGLWNNGSYAFEVVLQPKTSKQSANGSPDRALALLKPALCRSNGFISTYGLAPYPVTFIFTESNADIGIVQIPYRYCSTSP